MNRPLAALPLLLAMLNACGTDSVPAGKLKPTMGQETDTLTRSPRVTRFQSKHVAKSGKVTKLGDQAKVPDEFELNASEAGVYSLTGTDGSGEVLLVASSLSIVDSDMAGTEVPWLLTRRDIGTRPAGSFQLTLGKHPAVTLIGGHVLWAMAGESASSVATDGYDLAWFGHVAAPNGLDALTCPNPPCLFRPFVAFTDIYGLGISGADAVVFDASTGDSVALLAPSSLKDWSSQAGGITLTDADASTWLIGPARQTSASSAVVHITTAQAPVSHQLTAERQGAAAALVPGYGLVLVAGSKTGAGLEWLEGAAKRLTALPYPPDATSGAGLLVADDTHVLRLGGRLATGKAAPTLRYALDCSKACVAEPVPALNLELDAVRVYGSGSSQLLVGEDPKGVTRLYRYDGSKLTEVALREARSGASAVALPTGQLALIGGVNPETQTARSSLEFVAF